MSGLPWFELDTDFHDSPKVEALAARLREPLADAYIARVYAYCYRHARDRFDVEAAQGTIETAARWRGRRGSLFDALMAVGVLTREAGKVIVHGVAERLAPHIAKRLADAERQRTRRGKVAETVGAPLNVTRDVHATSRRNPGDVTRESRSNKDKDSNKDPIVSVGEGDSCSALPPRRGGLPLREEIRNADHPRTAALLSDLATQGCPIGHAAELPTRAGVEAALETAPDGAASRVLTAWAQTKRPTIGWYLDAITGPPAAKGRAPDPRAPVGISTDWSDPRAPWEIPS